MYRNDINFTYSRKKYNRCEIDNIELIEKITFFRIIKRYDNEDPVINYDLFFFYFVSVFVYFFFFLLFVRSLVEH